MEKHAQTLQEGPLGSALRPTRLLMARCYLCTAMFSMTASETAVRLSVLLYLVTLLPSDAAAADEAGDVDDVDVERIKACLSCSTICTTHQYHQYH